MFVFVSGCANAYVYGRVMQQRGFVTSAARILNRAFHLYVAQMFLFVISIGEIALLSHGTDVFADAMNVRIFREQPDVAIAVNMDVLPVYIVLLLGCPPMLWLLWRMPASAMAASGTLYALANVMDPTYLPFHKGPGISIRWHGSSCLCSLLGAGLEQPIGYGRRCGFASYWAPPRLMYCLGFSWSLPGTSGILLLMYLSGSNPR
jgi:OpgC protein